MGVFDNVGDIPGQLSQEALQITLKFQPGVPAAGQGTVSWNIPIADNPSAEIAYSGLVIIASDQPVARHNIPRNGVSYTADPTLDPDKFSGDRIGGAFVIGYVYQPDVKANNGILTTSIVVNDVDLTKNYYIAAYILDDQRRYDLNGCRAYSDRLGAADKPGTRANQTVLLAFNSNTFSAGVLPTDGTNLVAGATYQFQLIHDSQYPHGKSGVTNMLISFDGSVAGTYGDMVKEINRQIAIQCNHNTLISPVPPGQGIYYWDGEGQLWQWNGTTLTPVPNVIVQDTDPTLIAIGTYWYQPSTNTLWQWNGTIWVDIPFITSATDPTQPGPGSWWWNGTNAWSRCGDTWCMVDADITYISTTDPSCPAPPVNCAFWFNPTTSTLETWNGVQWVPAYAPTWPVAPNALTAGTYWYDLTEEKLYIRSVTPMPAHWNTQPFISSTTDPWPNGVAAGTLWYNPTTEVLNLRNGMNTGWIVTPVLVWPSDPTDIESCSLWFDDSGGSPGILKQWDVLNSIWTPVTPYFEQPTDPYGTPVIPTGAIWWNPDTGVLSIWTGNTWEVLVFVYSPTDPTIPPNGTVWYNTVTGEWQIWNTPDPGWNLITPIISNTAPNALPVGQLWFQTSVPNHLWQWNGTTWVELQFTTTKPTLSKGQVWYNSITGELMQWTGSVWQRINVCVMCKFDAKGNLVFETVGTGSNQVVMIPVPQAIPWMASGLTTYGTGAADYINDSISPYSFYPYGTAGGNSLFDVPIAGNFYNGLYSGLDYFGNFSGNIGNGIGPIDCWVDYPGDIRIPYRALPISPNAFLWSNLKPMANILLPFSGQDGVSGTPTYDQLGVGTDGSPDERRSIMGKIRTMLGYPTVQVELTDPQLDRCIQNALESFRQRSSMATQRKCFFLDIAPYNQHYLLTNKAVGYNKIVDVMAGYRFTSAFLSQAMGAGVYGQVVMQHLYNMGTFDLLSYHLVSQYVEQLELMFATRLTFTWNENTRQLDFHQSFTRPERILLDVAIEKTEQEIFVDRYSKRWIQQYALAEAMDILANIRGKYANLPGAGGNATLNVQDLKTQAKEIREQCQSDLDELIVQDVESYGAYGSVVMG